MQIPTILFIIDTTIFFVLGVLLKIFPARNINAIYGYRTAKSMSSPEMWKKANTLFANLFFIGSLAYVIISLILYFMTRIEVVLVTQAILMVLLLIITIIMTEIRLK